MWFTAKVELPYHGDPDYRDALIFGIRSRLGDVKIDPRLLEVYGSVDVACASMEELASVPLVRSVRTAVDREIVWSDPAIEIR